MDRAWGGALLLAVAVGCAPERDCDADRDGEPAPRCGGDDCNDAHWQVRPGAVEICDGLDNDCDGAVDLPLPDELETWYADGDGDGYGDAATTVEACAAPPGFVANSLDCDDSRTLVRPGAAEVCDGLDNDCDGTVDGEGALYPSTWWPDGDGDGFGDEGGAPVEACDAPDGYAGTDGDCDDEDPAVHPGATEVCTDGLDNDCNGRAPECGIWGVGDVDDFDPVTVEGLEEGAGLGRGLAVGALGPSDAAGLVVRPEYWPVSEGAFWFAEPLAAGPTTESADAVLGGPVEPFAIATGRDVTGDGRDDLLLVDLDTDSVHLFAGPIDGPLELTDAVATGQAEDVELYGLEVATLPDLDGDGIAEIAISATDFPSPAGQVFVFLGGPAVSLAPDDAAMVLHGDEYSWGFSVVGLPDVNGDGAPEIVAQAAD